MISGSSDPTRPAVHEGPSTGIDPTGSVSVTIDDSLRVTDVGVLRVDGVATTSDLDTAVTGAYRAAIAARRPPRERGEQRKRPVAVATVPPFPRRRPDSYDRHQIREATRAERAVRTRSRPAGDRVGRSANECVTVTLPPASSLGRVDAEAGWLVSADPTSIARSLTEAFAAAYSEGDVR